MTAEAIQAAVAAACLVRLVDLQSGLRTQRVADARAIAIYLCRRLLGMSFPELGRAFGRDHTSCWAAFARVQMNSRLLDRAVTIRMQIEAPLPAAAVDHADPEEVMA